MTAESLLIEESLERLVERAGDPTPAVYARLFARFPDMEALFVRDRDGAIRGEMLTKTLECALDLAGPNAYAANFIACEAVNHDGVGVPREIFATFFEVSVETFAELMGPEWTPAYAQAWAGLIARIAEITAAA
ncbi:MAG: globin [Phenylobacterium sp.]|nr:MAG: globin [Phenylobacterium sp.]